MSIAGYFVRRGQEWRMRRELRDEAGKDELGIKVEGSVLAGEKSLEERRAEDAVVTDREGEDFYSGIEEYDPVLRSHCRQP
jgi:hypothetical protein